MPVTPKPSRKFYAKLGDDVTSELVEWFDTVDTSQRETFKELVDASFGRIDTRIAELTARFDARISDVTARFDARFADLDARFDTRLVDLGARLEARMDAKLEGLKSELLKWMFLFWLGTMGTVLAMLRL